MTRNLNHAQKTVSVRIGMLLLIGLCGCVCTSIRKEEVRYEFTISVLPVVGEPGHYVLESSLEKKVQEEIHARKAFESRTGGDTRNFPRPVALIDGPEVTAGLDSNEEGAQVTLKVFHKGSAVSAEYSVRYRESDHSYSSSGQVTLEP
jgi:hypothetical protein